MISEHYLEKKPYLVDAIIGNSRMLASMSKTGQIYRLWWPHIDFPQHADEIRSGLFIKNSDQNATIWFDSTHSGYQHDSRYLPNTNILQVDAKHDCLPIAIQQTDFAVPNEDILVRHYQFSNTSSQNISFDFMYYSSFGITESPYYQTTQFVEHEDALVHFRHEYYFSVSSSSICSGYQSGYAWHGANHQILNGEQIAMTPDGALSWSFHELEAGQSVDVTIYITAGVNQGASLSTMAKAKSRAYLEWFNSTLQYWTDYLNAVPACPVDNENIRQLYNRSLLVMKLMSDEQTGSIVAAPEFDERFSRCGGYSYCWGRDAAFITTALDKAGLHDISERFYRWALTAQSPDGSWQQRHYHDGQLAPSWGLQIDEGASILWGMWQHYQATSNPWLLSDEVWESIQSGAKFLISYLDEQTGLPLPSRDLWEERAAEHSYSSAAVFGGLNAAAAFAEARQLPHLAQEWRNTAASIQSAIEHLCWDESKQRYLRGVHIAVSEHHYHEALQSGEDGFIKVNAKGYKTYYLDKDPIIDVSLLGLSIPFATASTDHPRMILTADAIEQALTVPGVGGIKRYEDDTYIGGNPWILTTLWLCHYRLQQGERERGLELLNWAVSHQTDLGLLPEQVDQITGQTAWVVPLTWSHAMFVLAVHMLK
jgi:glucoamylase